MKKLLLLFFAQIFLTSCFTTRTIVEERIVKTHDESMDEQCKNKTKSEILLKFGGNYISTDDGNNGEILVFDDSYTVTSGASLISIDDIFGVSIYNATTSKVKQEINFYINEDKKCYHWKTKGWDFTKKVLDTITQEPVGYIDPDRNLSPEKKVNNSVLKISILSVTIPLIIYLIITAS